MTRFEVTVHTDRGHDLTIDVSADSIEEIAETINNRVAYTKPTDFVRFGSLIIRQMNIEWIQVYPK